MRGERGLRPVVQDALRRDRHQLARSVVDQSNDLRASFVIEPPCRKNLGNLFAKLTVDSNCDKQKGVRMNWSARRVLLGVAVAALVVVGAASAVVSRSTVAPTNSSLPTISGTAAVGSTVTANPGTWSGSTPITYQYQWSICGSDGARFCIKSASHWSGIL